jgi:hypothetical protein
VEEVGGVGEALDELGEDVVSRELDGGKSGK